MTLAATLSLALALAPTAIVDSVRGVPGLRALQLLAPGDELALPADGRLRLAYFASCVHETVRGGRLRIGVTASFPAGAMVERVTADCEVPPGVVAGAPGALVLRDRAGRPEPLVRLRSRAPVLLVDGVPVRLEGLAPGRAYRVCTPRGCKRLWLDPHAPHRAGPVLERVTPIP